MLLRNRRKPISIAARAVIRAGKGHRYWSAFNPEKAQEIENISKELHQVLFEPEVQRPIKTLALPLGGSQGVRTALQILIDFMLIASKNQNGSPKKISDYADDSNGDLTIESLRKSLKLAKRITGNDRGSLGLHPAVYFYGPTGRHSEPLFLGTVALFGNKLANNDQTFFQKFTSIRAKLESLLIENKDLIATIMQKHTSNKRVEKYWSLLEDVVPLLLEGKDVSDSTLVSLSGLQGKIVTGNSSSNAQKFSEDAKSGAFINVALSSAMLCPICGGYLDTEKSVSYDHVQRVRDGGIGSSENCQLTHPYCNQSIKQ